MKKWMTNHCCCCLNKSEKAVDLEFERKDQERPVNVYDIVSAGANGGTNGGGIVNKAYDDNVIVKQPTITSNEQTKIVDTYKNNEIASTTGGDTNEVILTPPPPPEGKSLSDLVFEELDRSQSLANSSHHQGTSFFSVPDAVDPPLENLPKKDDQQQRRKPKSPPPPPPQQEDNADEGDVCASLDRVSADLPRDDLAGSSGAVVEDVPAPVVDVSAICKGGISVETGEKCTRSQMKKCGQLSSESGEVEAPAAVEEAVDVVEEVAQEEPQQEAPTHEAVEEEQLQQDVEPIQNEVEVNEEPAQAEELEQKEPTQPEQPEEVKVDEPTQQESKPEVVEEPVTQQQSIEEEQIIPEEEPKPSEEQEEQKQTEEETTATPNEQVDESQEEDEEEESRRIQETTASAKELQVEDEDNTMKQASTVWRDRLARELLEDDIEFISSTDDDDDDEEKSVTSQSPQQRKRIALVIDNGTWEVRSGFGGKFSPDCRTRNVIGRWKSETGEAWRGQLGSRFYGDNAIQKHSTLTLQSLIKDGVVCDWKDMVGMWSFIIEEELDSDVTQHPLVVSEPVGVDRRQRERMLEILVESMRVPGVLLRSQAQLALYSQQAESGLVVNCGHSGTQIAPIYQGYQLNYGCSILDVGGQQITDQLSRLVQKERGITFASVGEVEAINSIKENYAYVADAEEKQHADKQEVVLPDGREMELDNELWMCTEAIFQPDLIGSSSPGLHQLVMDSIKKLPINTLRNGHGEIEVVLAGGTGTKLDGLAERLQLEVDSLMTSTSDDVITVKVANCGPDAAWIGGSLLADQDEDFDRLLVDERTYTEHGGSKIVHQMF